MVLVPLAREALKVGIKAFTRYYRLEGKAFDKLYSGFPRARTIGRGVRHGLTTGSVAGSLIAPDTPGNENGISQQRNGFKTNPPYKTRNRFPVRDRSRYSRKYCPRPSKRRPYFSSPKFRRNRF